MKEESTGKCLRQPEHIRGHLWHIYSIAVNQVVVATVKLSKSYSFPIVNFPFTCSNIPAAPAYGVYISQLIRYSRGSTKHTHKTGSELRCSGRVSSSCSTSGPRRVNLVTNPGDKSWTWLTDMENLYHKWPRICSTCRKHFSVLSSFMTYHRGLLLD
jgi:hypothetical protein